MLDTPTARPDKPVDNPDVQAKLSAAAEVPPGSALSAPSTTGDTGLPAGALPALTIDGTDSANTRMPSGAMAVAKDLGSGAWDEITQHPGQVAESAAIGLAIGAAAGAVGPEIAIGAAAVGAAYGTYELLDHAGSWISSAKTVDNPGDSTPAQVAQANLELQNVGAGAVNVAAAMVGGAGGSYLAGAIAGSLTAPAAEAAAVSPAVLADSGDAPVAIAAATLPGDAPAAATAPVLANEAPPPTMAPTPTVDAPVSPGDAPASTGDAPASTPAATPPADAPKPAAENTPENSGRFGQSVTTSDTTMTITNPSTWAKLVDHPGSFSPQSLAFANRWATQIEQQMAAGNPMTKAMVDSTEKAADTQGLNWTEKFNGKIALFATWKYGEQLRDVIYS